MACSAASQRDDPGGVRSLEPGSDATELVRDLDGKRLEALRVTSIKELRPEERPKLTPVDRALGVTEKRLFSTIVTLDERTIERLGALDHRQRAGRDERSVRDEAASALSRSRQRRLLCEP